LADGSDRIPSFDYEWDDVDSFDSDDEYERFLTWISDQVTEGRAAVVSLDPAKAWGNAWDEHWYQCLADREVWRLVGSDPLFAECSSDLIARSISRIPLRIELGYARSGNLGCPETCAVER
jgi:hypothetical protein